MKIAELFVANVTRDIPPVVYFHEQRPEKIKEEVGEYIITGGYRENDPRFQRVKQGIHEQFVHLLRGITQEMGKKGGPENPACWISGFYGSGKSSFAKLLGLSLDNKMLPDGTLLSKALLERDDSPKRDELVTAWNDLLKRVQPMAVVFDIGGVARDDEHIHSAALRQVQGRLGYCANSSLVADFELRLEMDDEYGAFLSTAEKVLGRPWSEAMKEEQAEDHFSHVLHVMKPDRYPDPMSWIDARAGRQTGAGSSVVEVVRAIEAMLDARGGDKALFIVIDEVSQYVHQDEGRMLKLQTFVMDLGQQLKGRVWLLATGQQKLEDTSESTNIGKLIIGAQGYLDLVNDFYGFTGKEAISLPAGTHAPLRITTLVAEVMRPRASAPIYDHLTPSLHLMENRSLLGKLAGVTEALTRFERLFTDINTLLAK